MRKMHSSALVADREQSFNSLKIGKWRKEFNYQNLPMHNMQYVM